MPDTQRVLIVEDEPLIAMMLEDFLRALDRAPAGSVDNVGAALDRLRGDDVDAVILDVHLRDGEQCWPVADALASKGVPFILATGGMNDVIAAQHRWRPVLSKPYTMDSVEQALDNLP